jgi:NAD dependent epimerase/dehydratase family enzyme
MGCEEEAEQIAANGSIVTVVRLGLVIAPGGFLEPLRKLHASGFTWRTPHQDAVIPAIDIEDAVGVLTSLVRSRRAGGPVHAVAPEPLRSADLKALLEEASPRRLRVALPRLALRRAIGTLADVVHSRQQVVPQRLMEAGFQFERPNPLDSVHAVLAGREVPPAEEEPPEAQSAEPRRKRRSLIAGMLQRAERA